MAIQRFKEQSQGACLARALALACTLAFIPIYLLMGKGAAAPVAVPVVLAAWSMGLRAGVAAGLLGLPMSALLLSLAGDQAWDVLVQPGGVVPYAFPLVLGGAVGWLSDRHKLLEREQRTFRQETAESSRTSQALRESEERYRALADLSPEMVAVQSEGRYVYINPAGASLLGASAPGEIIGRMIGDFVHAEHREKVGQWLQQTQEEGTRANPFPSKSLRLDGRVIDVEVTGAPITYDGKPAIQVILRDVTERKRLEANLRHRQKLEIVGELAAGVAHEVNNPLSVIAGFSELLLARELGEDVREDVQTIFEEAQRAERVIQGLLSFARRGKPVETMIDVTQVLDRVLALKAYDFRLNHIETELRLKPDMPLVMADEGQLLQVVFNIMTNAQQAMADSHGKGNLLISGERVGNNLRLSFADDGPGIAQDNLRKIFDPFFTTKGVRGTGLGLSVSYGIVAEHGGRIWAESQLGLGATFFVEMPGMPG